jgi:hypothetical protein
LALLLARKGGGGWLRWKKKLCYLSLFCFNSFLFKSPFASMLLEL